MQKGRGAVPEVRLALAGALACLLLAPVATSIGWLVGGGRAALSAAVAYALVGLLALTALPLYRRASDAKAVGTAALLGFGQRLLLATAVFAVVDRIPAISMTAFALAFAAALATSVGTEITLSLRDPRLSYVDPKGATG